LAECAHGRGVAIGDFATATVEATFTLPYLVYNTIMNLTTQDAQVACFRTSPRISRRAHYRVADDKLDVMSIPFRYV
jgi:hypothetical protein